MVRDVFIPIISLIFILTSIKPVQGFENSKYNPKNMDYEMRRPITYLYNRLAYKFDINPYTSHLIHTQLSCSSKKVPFCGFINQQNLVDPNFQIPQQIRALNQALVANTQYSRQIARDIQNGKLDAFLISSQSHKQYDVVIKQIIDNYFFKPSSEIKTNTVKKIKQSL